MQTDHSEEDLKPKNLELDRLVFFSDAIVAIAITLLALDLRMPEGNNEHLTFRTIWEARLKFGAFFLSFLYISVFWINHHHFFSQIKKIDHNLLRYNLLWLLFIVLLPFATTLISAHFSDTAAISTYCFNTFMVTVFQNLIWDYAAARPDYLKHPNDKKLIYRFSLDCNVAMLNALLALGIAFISPVASFVILVTRLPMIAIARKIFENKK